MRSEGSGQVANVEKPGRSGYSAHLRHQLFTNREEKISIF